MADAFYRAAPRLPVHPLSAGYDNVDLAAARRAEIPVANNGGANAISVSEHAMMRAVHRGSPCDLAAR